MPLGSRYKPSAVKPSVSWSSRLRVAEEDDEPEAAPKPTGLSPEIISNTAALLQSIQDSARSCPRIPSAPVNPAKKDAIPDAGPKSMQTRLPLRSADDTSLIPNHIKRDAPSGLVPPQSAPDSMHRTLDETSANAQPTPAATDDCWVKSESLDAPRVDGQPALHDGQPGIWRCLSNAPYSSHKTWVFVPDKVPAPKGKVSRTKRRKSKRKAKTGFLSLPGELRNEIYKYLIPECRILITCNKPNKELSRAKNVWSEQNVEHKRPRPRLCHLLDLNQVEQGLGITKDLLLACKQVRYDVELYLYSRTTFCFSSTKALHRFLNTASKPGLQAIRNLEILHKGYGLPEMTEHQRYRDKYYERWTKACMQVGEQLSGLQYLKLEAHMRDWPCDLASAVPNTPWRKACLQMAPRRLPKVEVKLCHHMIHRNDMVLKELARRLENDMMTQDGQDDRDRVETEQVLKDLAAKRAAKEARAAARAAKLKAPQSLTISQADIQQSKPTSVKVCRKGNLDKYSSVDTSKMCVAELQNFKDEYCSEKHKAVLA